MTAMRPWKSFLILFALVGGGFLAHAPLLLELGLAAQTPEELRREAGQRTGQPLSDEEVLRRIRASGMSPSEIRRELERRGVDPRVAEAFLQGTADGVAAGTDLVPLLEVLSEREAEGPRGEIPPPAARPDEADVGDSEPPVYGRHLFGRATSEFVAITTGPVPRDYRLGPDDELTLVVTGDVELAYDLRVSREGAIVIPDVGRLFVSGRTMEELQDVLFQRLSQIYSGIRRGPDATTHFDVSMGRLRSNQVYVIGEVERPAAYEVSGLATVLTALYHAGGPTRAGSFREVRVNRGGETIATVDLYEYLARGVAESDVRLEHGDVVFVPPARQRVELSGSVVRPGRFELSFGESLRDLLEHSGGVRPEAELRRVQIERILDPGDRGPGRDRAILDVPVGDLESDGREPIPIRDGDRVRIFAVLDELENQVTVSGGVWRPGTYAVGPNTRLWEVIERAGGLVPDVVEGRAQIQRLRSDWTRTLIPVVLDPQSGEDPLIQSRDEILVYAARDLREDRQVSVGGWVREPGMYPYSEGMTVADLVLRAGGLRTGAYLSEAEVSRVVMTQERTQLLTESHPVRLDSALVFDRARPDGAGNPAGDISRTEAGTFTLENLDAVYIRKAPGFDPQETVVVTGEVLFPGPYSISSRGERLSDLMERAGGLTVEAYPEGFQLWRVRDLGRQADPDWTAVDRFDRFARDSETTFTAPAGRTVSPAEVSDLERALQEEDDLDRIRELETRLEWARAQEQIEDREMRTRVGIDLARVMDDPDHPANIFVHPNDSIHVPTYIPTVDVRGAVAAPTMVLYRPGAGLDYYIRQAGGYVEGADEDRVRIQFANGEVATRGRSVFFIGGGIARPDPGSVVTVPRKEREERIAFRDVLGIATSTATAVGTILLALSRF